MTTPRCNGACWGCGAAHAHAWFITTPPTSSTTSRRRCSAVSGECPGARCGRVLGARTPGTPTAQHLIGDVPTRRLHIIGAYARHPSLGTTDSTPWSAETMRHRCFTSRQRGNMRVANMIAHDVAPSAAAAAYQLLHEAPAPTPRGVFDWAQV
jgi:hypothetical protein